MLKSIGVRYSQHHRQRRAAQLRERLALDIDRTILDLGGGDGSHVKMIWPERENIVIADLDRK